LAPAPLGDSVGNLLRPPVDMISPTLLFTSISNSSTEALDLKLATVAD
jgi:hypothetical protein